MRLEKKIIEQDLMKSKHTEYIQEFSDLGLNYKLSYSPFELIFGDNDSDFKILAIVGQSGSGKSTLLQSLQKEFQDSPKWHDFRNLKQNENSEGFEKYYGATVEYIHDDPQRAVECLTSVGLNSVPCWLKPFSVLSTGEKFRAIKAWYLARYDKLYFDEYASVLDEDTAMSVSVALHKAIHREDKQLIVATCRRDILPYLKPCVVVDLDKEQVFTSRGWERQEYKLELYRCDRSLWRFFSQHHYLTSELPDGANSFLITCTFPNGKKKVVGYHAINRFAHPHKNGWLSSRVVVLPQFQGMGIGTKITELTGNYLVGTGYRLFCKTSHPILGRYRDKHPDRWRATKHNNQRRMSYLKRGLENSYTKRKGKECKNTSVEKIKWAANRLCFSHEYVGGTTYVDRSLKQMSLF